MTFIANKFSTSGVLRSTAHGSATPAMTIARGALCSCDTTVELCDYSSAVNVTAAQTVLGVQYTLNGTQATHYFNGGAGFPVPAGGSATTTELIKAAFKAFLAQYIIEENGDVVLTTNTLTFTSTNDSNLVLDNVVRLGGTTAFSASGCTTL